jgi:hypothetical protein
MTSNFRLENSGSPISPSSITSSFISDTAVSTKSSAFLFPAPTVLPLPAYVAFAAASQLATDNHISQAEQETEDLHQSSFERSQALFTDQALNLLNAFLDELLYSFLVNARSTSLDHLRTAVGDVLRGKLAQLALDAAQAELEDLLAPEDDADLPSMSDGEDGLAPEDIDLIFRRTRLRIMVYMRLGEMEDEDEERYVQSEVNGENTSNKRFSQSSRLVPWSAAIFLTAVLEFIAEQCIVISAETAYRRNRSKRIKQQSGLTSYSPDSDDDRIYVDEHDVEKLALSSVLSRLWRIWRKNLRTRPRSRIPASPTTNHTRYTNLKESSRPARLGSPLAMTRDNHDIASEDSDALPQQGLAVTTLSLPQSANRSDSSDAVAGEEDSDSETLGRAVLPKISEDEASDAAGNSSGSDNPALFPITNRSSLHSHPAFDAANYPPEIAAAAGLATSAKGAAQSNTTTSTEDIYDLTQPDHRAGSVPSAGQETWAKNVAERVLVQSPILPSANAFAAQARAAEARSRSGTVDSSTEDRSTVKENHTPLKSIMKTQVNNDMPRLQPVDGQKYITPSLTPPGDRHGSVNSFNSVNMLSANSANMTSPMSAGSEYSVAPTLGVAEIRTAQPIHAHAITPPRSMETLPKSEPATLLKEKVKKPLKIPRNLIPAPKSSPSSRGLIAREPKVERESTRDFADFIRSTAPTEEQTRVPLLANDFRSDATQGSSAASSPAVSKPLPSLPRTPLTGRSPAGPSSRIASSYGKTRRSPYEPRDAVVRDRGTGDLVDFLRQGPPGASVGPVLPDEDMSTSTTTGDRNGSVITQSAHGSVNSHSALVSGNAARAEPQQARAASNAGNYSDAPEATKTRRRIRDPYAIPSSDDDDDEDTDELTALPGQRTTQQQRKNDESLIDFLQNSAPSSQASHTGPTSSLPSAVHARGTGSRTSQGPTATSTQRSSPTLPPAVNSRSRNSTTAPARSTNGRTSPNPSAVLSTSAFFTTSSPPTSSPSNGTSSSAPQLPDFMKQQQPISIDLNQLGSTNRSDPMAMKYNGYSAGDEDDDDSAPAPTVSRDRGSKEMLGRVVRDSGSGKKGGGFWRRV